MEFKGAGAYLWVKRYNESWIHSSSIPVSQYAALFPAGRAEDLNATVPIGKVTKDRQSGLMSISKFVDQHSNKFPFDSPNTRYEVQLKVGDKANSSKTRTLFNGVITNVNFTGENIEIHAKGWLEVLSSIPATFSDSDLLNLWGGDEKYMSIFGDPEEFINVSDYLKRVVQRVPDHYVPPDTRQAALAFLNRRSARSSYYVGDSNLPMAGMYEPFIRVQILERRNKLLLSQISANSTNQGELLQKLISQTAGEEERGLARLHDVDTEATVMRLITNLSNTFHTQIITSPTGDWYLAPTNRGLHFHSNKVVSISDSEIEGFSSDAGRSGRGLGVRAAVMPHPGGASGLWDYQYDADSPLAGGYKWEDGSLGKVVSAGPLWPEWLPRNSLVLPTAGRIITAMQFVNSSFEGRSAALTLRGNKRILPMTLIRIGSKINDIIGNAEGGSSNYYGVVTGVGYRGSTSNDKIEMKTVLHLQPFMNKEVYEEIESKEIGSSPAPDLYTHLHSPSDWFRSVIPVHGMGHQRIQTTPSGPALNHHLFYDSLWVGGTL